MVLRLLSRRAGSLVDLRAGSRGKVSVTGEEARAAGSDLGNLGGRVGVNCWNCLTPIMMASFRPRRWKMQARRAEEAR